MNLFDNPELRRNLWLELTPYRLVGMPVALSVIFFLFYLLDDHHFGPAVANAALAIYCLLIFLWGTRQAAETIISEIRDHTWDNQRMSVIGPWMLLWGKLLGSTVYPWYGGLLALLVYALAAPPPEHSSLGKIVVILLAAGLFSHAVALLASLQAIRKDRRYSRTQTAAFLVLGIGVGFPLLQVAFLDDIPVHWYGFVGRYSDFGLVSALVFLLWAIIAVARLFRVELRMRSYPYVWCLFVLFLMVYVGGFLPQFSLAGWLWCAAAIAAVLVYGMLFSERKDPVAVYRLLREGQSGNWREVAVHLPLWVVTLGLMLLVVLVLAVVLLTTSAVSLVSGPNVIVLLAACCFVLRDVGVLLHANMGEHPRRADMMTVLLLVMLYGVVPGILAALDLELLTAFFWPRTDLPGVLVLIAPLLELLLVGWLVVRRWQQRFA